ncbi:class C sortase [Sporosarcina jiandibaonis]|uniref:class C sortase n=1 Tax=Sporosarcina jiandibaonis TaxID=2715535 RepID=UPI0015561DB8|nr:class C sortase [Sporosarcina jiandibaonis]
MKRNVLFAIVFLIGLAIFAYPIMSNVLATKEHHTIISERDEEILKLTKSEIKDLKDQAAAYNEKIINSTVPIEDPFAEESEGTTVTGYFNVLNIGESMGSLEIPKIDVKLPIYHGTGEKVLASGVGHLSNTSLPIGGKGTHAVMTGHRGLPSAKMFRNLDKLKVGDLFFIKSLDETLVYKVDQVSVVLPNEVELLGIEEGKDFATLITCEPYMINTHRMLVRGERIGYRSESEVMERLNEENNMGMKKAFNPFGAIMIALLIILAVSYLIYRKKVVKAQNEE